MVSDRPEVITSSETPIPEAATKPTPGFFKELLTAFITIFLAELGDKTQLSTLLITAESNSPWVVFCGAASALLATSFLGVVIGRWLAKRLSEDVLKTATGSSLLAISVWMLWDILQFQG
jgi:Ca2+/H+ antiporter, TMEM165/GDT1 family